MHKRFELIVSPWAFSTVRGVRRILFVHCAWCMT